MLKLDFNKLKKIENILSLVPWIKCCWVEERWPSGWVHWPEKETHPTCLSSSFPSCQFQPLSINGTELVNPQFISWVPAAEIVCSPGLLSEGKQDEEVLGKNQNFPLVSPNLTSLLSYCWLSPPMPVLKQMLKSRLHCLNLDFLSSTSTPLLLSTSTPLPSTTKTLLPTTTDHSFPK